MTDVLHTDRYTERHETTYHGLTVEVFKDDGDSMWRLYPWRFRVMDKNGMWQHFAGVPNYCETKRSALKRAWYRAKWIAEGTFSKRYQ